MRAFLGPQVGRGGFFAILAAFAHILTVPPMDGRRREVGGAPPVDAPILLGVSTEAAVSFAPCSTASPLSPAAAFGASTVSLPPGSPSVALPHGLVFLQKTLRSPYFHSPDVTTFKERRNFTARRRRPAGTTDDGAQRPATTTQRPAAGRGKARRKGPRRCFYGLSSLPGKPFPHRSSPLPSPKTTNPFRGARTRPS